MFKGGAVIKQLRPLDAGRVLVPSEGSYPYAREFDSRSRKSVFFPWYLRFLLSQI